MVPVFGPNTLVLLLLDGDLDGDIVTLLLVLLGAILLGHLVAFGHSVSGAVLLRHIVAFRHIDVVTGFVRDLGTLLLVVVRRFTFFGVSGLTLLFLLVGALLFVGSFTMLLLLVSTFFPVFGVALGDFVLLASLLVFGLVFGDIVLVFLLALAVAHFFGHVVVDVVARERLTEAYFTME